MAGKELQKKRILIYFIEATQEIMNEDGISNITIRKVAQRAGYNSATLYNYFDDLEQLILYASLRYLHLYTEDLSKELPQCKTERERFLQLWRSFCLISFLHPEPFERIFFCKYSSQLGHIYSHYYELFPEEKKAPSEDLAHVFSSIHLEERNRIALEHLYEEEKCCCTSLKIKNELMIYAYHELLHQCTIHTPLNATEAQAYIDKMFSYINFILEES